MKTMDTDSGTQATLTTTTQNEGETEMAKNSTPTITEVGKRPRGRAPKDARIWYEGNNPESPKYVTPDHPNYEQALPVPAPRRKAATKTRAAKTPASGRPSRPSNADTNDIVAVARAVKAQQKVVAREQARLDSLNSRLHNLTA